MRSALVGSLIPASIISTYSSVSALKPRVTGTIGRTFSPITEPDRLLESTSDNHHSDAVVARELQAVERLRGAEERHAASGHDQSARTFASRCWSFSRSESEVVSSIGARICFMRPGSPCPGYLHALGIGHEVGERYPRSAIKLHSLDDVEVQRLAPSTLRWPQEGPSRQRRWTEAERGAQLVGN